MAVRYSTHTRAVKAYSRRSYRAATYRSRCHLASSKRAANWADRRTHASFSWRRATTNDRVSTRCTTSYAYSGSRVYKVVPSRATSRLYATPAETDSQTRRGRTLARCTPLTAFEGPALTTGGGYGCGAALVTRLERGCTYAQTTCDCQWSGRTRSTRFSSMLRVRKVGGSTGCPLLRSVRTYC